MEFLLETKRPGTKSFRRAPVRINKTCISISAELLRRNGVTPHAWWGNIVRKDDAMYLFFANRMVNGCPKVTTFTREKHNQFVLNIPKSNQKAMEPLMGNYKIGEIRHTEKGDIYIQIRKMV